MSRRQAGAPGYTNGAPMNDAVPKPGVWSGADSAVMPSNEPAQVKRWSKRARIEAMNKAGEPLDTLPDGPAREIRPPDSLKLYLPHPESRLCMELAHGSAIVGLPLANGEIRIYFEGNVIGASNLELYRARAAQATSRMLHNYPAGYPTRAREDVDPRELIEVGTIEPRTDRLDITASANELSWWIGPTDLADLGFRLEAG